MVINFFKFPPFPQICCAFTGRGDGQFGGNVSFNADPASARRSREQILGHFKNYGLRAFAECRQTHGTNIIVNPEPEYAIAEAMSCLEGDGMITDCPGIGLMIKTADCQPLLLTDGRHVMAAHVGWRGNRQNFPGKAVIFFSVFYRIPPEKIWAVRGPSLGNAEFVNVSEDWSPGFMKWYNPGTRTMDLWQLTRWQLEQANVPKEHIYSIDIDTLANADAWFSWRRHKTPGRQSGIIWIGELQ